MDTSLAQQGAYAGSFERSNVPFPLLVLLAGRHLGTVDVLALSPEQLGTASPPNTLSYLIVRCLQEHQNKKVKPLGPVYSEEMILSQWGSNPPNANCNKVVCFSE